LRAGHRYERDFLLSRDLLRRHGEIQLPDHFSHSRAGLSFNCAQLVGKGYVHQHRMTPTPRLQRDVFLAPIGVLVQGDARGPPSALAGLRARAMRERMLRHRHQRRSLHRSTAGDRLRVSAVRLLSRSADAGPPVLVLSFGSLTLQWGPLWPTGGRTPLEDVACTVTATQAAQRPWESCRPRRSRSSKVRILRVPYWMVTDLEWCPPERRIATPTGSANASRKKRRAASDPLGGTGSEA
jgi:hypothetical protein